MNAGTSMVIGNDYSPKQLDIIRTSVAKGTNREEFDYFMSAARKLGLDPFRKQISIIIFNANKPDKRSSTLIVGRDGYRVIAARCGDYRPNSEAAKFIYDENAKSDMNPEGIVSCQITLFKQDNRGEWWPVFGEAYWNEFVPEEQRWEWSEQDNRRMPVKDADGNIRKQPGGNWKKMPRLMLEKCAEAQALRKGWPDEMGGLYAAEELEHQTLRDVTPEDLTPTEQIEKHKADERMKRIGGPALLMVFNVGDPILERVPLGEVHDRCTEFIKKQDAATIYLWRKQNGDSLKEFYAHDAGAAHDLKKQIEAKLQNYDPTADQGETANA